jgi:ABC-2 type transport system ATP-binding protein
VRSLFKQLVDEGRAVLVSSHLMREMEQTAEELIAMGRGKLIAAESLRDFAASSTPLRVSIRTPDADVLPALLTDEGATVRAELDGSYTVTGLPADRIGELAFAHGVRMHELSPHSASLEEAFMELTAESVEYSAGAVRSPPYSARFPPASRCRAGG